MTAWARAFLGAALGALITLTLHPVSRPYLTEAFLHRSPLQVSALATQEMASLPPPADPVSAGAWLQMGAEKVHGGLGLTPKELKTLLAIDDEADRVQPDNAYWPQMKAVLLDLQGKEASAEAAWVRASNRTTWNDEQTARLLALRQRIADRLSWNESWTYGYVYFERSEAAATVIQRFASKLVKHTDLDSDSGLRLRYATVQNGSLLRDGSRSIRVGLHGYDMVERASYPASLSGTGRARRIWIAETKMTARLRQVGMTDESRKAFEAFGNNDGWRALTGAEVPENQDLLAGNQDLWRSVTHEQSAEENARSLCLVSVGLAGFPGTMALGALLGGLVLGFGMIVQPRFSSLRFFSAWTAVGGGLVLGLIVFWATRIWAAGMSVSVTAAFLIVGPNNPRNRKSDDLGPLYALLLSTLWVVSLCAFGLYVLATSTAARSIAPMLGPSGEYIGDAPLFLAVTSIVLSLICLVAPLYGIVRRYGTPDMLALSLRRLGVVGSTMALAFCIVGWPLTVFADRLCSNELKELVENEPIYYLVAP